MIIGLGSDLCSIERIQNSLDRFGERFEMRVFTEIERAKARITSYNVCYTKLLRLGRLGCIVRFRLRRPVKPELPSRFRTGYSTSTSLQPTVQEKSLFPGGKPDEIPAYPT